MARCGTDPGTVPDSLALGLPQVIGDSTDRGDDQLVGYCRGDVCEGFFDLPRRSIGPVYRLQRFDLQQSQLRGSNSFLLAFEVGGGHGR